MDALTLLDTSVLALVVGGEWSPGGPFAVSAVTLAETVRGAMLHPGTAHIEAALGLIAALPAGSVLPFGEEEARVYGRLAPGVTARKRTNDLMIVATAVRHGAWLVSADTGVGRIVDALDAEERPGFTLLGRGPDGGGR